MSYAQQENFNNKIDAKFKPTPRKSKVHAKAKAFIERAQNDNKTKLIRDLINEVQRLQKEVDLMRTVNAACKKENDTYHFEFLRERIEANQETEEVEDMDETN